MPRFGDWLKSLDGCWWCNTVKMWHSEDVTQWRCDTWLLFLRKEEDRCEGDMLYHAVKVSYMFSVCRDGHSCGKVGAWLGIDKSIGLADFGEDSTDSWKLWQTRLHWRRIDVITAILYLPDPCSCLGTVTLCLNNLVLSATLREKATRVANPWGGWRCSWCWWWKRESYAKVGCTLYVLRWVKSELVKRFPFKPLQSCLLYILMWTTGVQERLWRFYTVLRPFLQSVFWAKST
jgi:hypothetical protein